MHSHSPFIFFPCKYCPLSIPQINRQELRHHEPEELARVRDDLLAWADREREKWRTQLAAVAIQRRIR